MFVVLVTLFDATLHLFGERIHDPTAEPTTGKEVSDARETILPYAGAELDDQPSLREQFMHDLERNERWWSHPTWPMRVFL